MTEVTSSTSLLGTEQESSSHGHAHIRTCALEMWKVLESQTSTKAALTLLAEWLCARSLSLGRVSPVKGSGELSLGTAARSAGGKSRPAGTSCIRSANRIRTVQPCVWTRL